MNDKLYPLWLALFDRDKRAVWIVRSHGLFLMACAASPRPGHVDLSPWPLTTFRTMKPNSAATHLERMAGCFFRSEKQRVRYADAQHHFQIIPGLQPPRYLVGTNGPEHYVLHTLAPMFLARVAAAQGRSCRLYDQVWFREAHDADRPQDVIHHTDRGAEYSEFMKQLAEKDAVAFLSEILFSKHSQE